MPRMPGARGAGRRPLLPGRGPLAAVPPAVAFLVVLAVFGLGVWLRGPLGACLLGLLVVGVLALLGATWTVLTPAQRLLRALVVLLLIMITVSVLR